jgi:hypothetical protein
MTHTSSGILLILPVRLLRWGLLDDFHGIKKKSFGEDRDALGAVEWVKFHHGD